LITGFPGEDESAFENTLGFVRELPIAYLHVFPFSARPGTRAASLDNQIDVKARLQRAGILRRLGKEKWLAHRRRFVGQTFDCLVESKRREGRLVGLTGNYIRIEFDGGEELRNTLVAVELKSVADQSCSGTFHRSGV
jgi:threonylcarbamoyladenosine tRNA methylthiotransferase MtaB